MLKIYSIEELAEIIGPIAKEYEVKSVWLFGSYARGEATEASDVDLLIDGGQIGTLYQLSAFQIALEDALRKPVDLVTLGSSDQEFVRRIHRNEVVIYDAARSGYESECNGDDSEKCAENSLIK